MTEFDEIIWKTINEKVINFRNQGMVFANDDGSIMTDEEVTDRLAKIAYELADNMVTEFCNRADKELNLVMIEEFVEEAKND